MRQADGSWVDQPVARSRSAPLLRSNRASALPMDGCRPLRSDQHQPGAGDRREHPGRQGAGSGLRLAPSTSRAHSSSRSPPGLGFDVLARIIHAVEEAQATRAPTQGGSWTASRPLHASHLRHRAGRGSVGPWLLGWTWLEAIYKALVLLVIACPCAGDPTPVTIVSGLAAGPAGAFWSRAASTWRRPQDQGDRAGQDRHDHRRQAAPGGLGPWWTRPHREPAVRSTLRSAAALGPPGLQAIARASSPQRRGHQFHGAGRARCTGRDRGATYVLGNHRLIESRASARCAGKPASSSTRMAAAR